MGVTPSFDNMKREDKREGKALGGCGKTVEAALEQEVEEKGVETSGFLTCSAQ